MTFRIRALLAGAIVAALLLAATTASAGRLSFRNSLGTREWRAPWAPMEFSGGFGTTTCGLTLEGSFHSGTITKTRDSLVGYVTNARASGCGILTASVLTETLPWHMRYQSFTGALPNISSVSFSIIGFSFRIRETGAGVTCLMRSEEEEPIFMTWSRAASGSVTTATLGGTIISDCGIAGTFGGRASVTPATSITLI